jgi:ketosteroid isomerase-like protein
MGQAREVMDKLTSTLVTTGDLKAIAMCYAEDATIMTPDQGEVTGRDQIVEWWRPFVEALDERSWEPLHEHEIGDTAIDEGYFGGMHSAPLHLPSGQTVPPTGRRVRTRGADLAQVVDGHIVEHRFYFDQMELLEQLGLTES